MKAIVNTRETRRLAAIANAKDLMGAVRRCEPGVYKTRDAILALGDDATIEEIRACSVDGCGPRPALQAWCDGCDTKVDSVVIVGEEPGYDTSTAQLCEQCLLDALSALRESQGGGRK